MTRRMEKMVEVSGLNWNDCSRASNGGGCTYSQLHYHHPNDFIWSCKPSISEWLRASQ